MKILSDEQVIEIQRKTPSTLTYERTEDGLFVKEIHMEPILQAQAKLTREETLKEVMDWIQSYAVHGGRLPVKDMIDVMEAHSPYKRYLWQSLLKEDKE